MDNFITELISTARRCAKESNGEGITAMTYHLALKNVALTLLLVKLLTLEEKQTLLRRLFELGSINHWSQSLRKLTSYRF